MADVIQLRRDTASNWTSANPTLASGELGLETDTSKLKLGTGSGAWNSLSYYTLATVGYAPLASPTFTGAVNASGTLQIAGTTITSTAAELNILDGVTSTAAELNKLDGVTATTAELNILDGVTSTAAELNKLDGVTADTAELNILDGVTATTAKLNLLDALSRGSILYGNASGATTVLTKGTAAQLLTSDGTDIAWANAPASGGSIEATATGAITAGKSCKINSNGTVSQISTTALGISDITWKGLEVGFFDQRQYNYGTAYGSPHAIRSMGITWDKHRNQFIMVGWEATIKCWMCVIGQIKSGHVLWQSPYKIVTKATSNTQPGQNQSAMAIWYDETSDRIVCIVEPGGQIFLAIPQEDGGYAFDYHESAYEQADDFFGAEFYNGEGVYVIRDGSKIELVCLTITKDWEWGYVTDGDIEYTKRSQQVASNPAMDYGASSYINMALDTENGEVCIVADKSGGGSEWWMYLLEIGSSGDPTALYASSAGTSGEKDYPNIAYISPKKYLVTYQNSSGYASAQILTFSGSTPTWHTATQLNTVSVFQTYPIALKDGRLFVKWADNSAFLTLDGSNNITVGTVRVDNQGYGSPGTTMLTGGNTGFSRAYSPTSDVALGTDYEGLGQTLGFSTSTFYPDTYIGIAQATVANAATATLDIIGGVNAQQSSLTIGKKYYVHYDGTLGTGYSDVYAGMSTSATKLLVKG